MGKRGNKKTGDKEIKRWSEAKKVKRVKLRSLYIPHLYLLDHRYEDRYVALIHGFGHGAQQDQWSELMPRPASERIGMRLYTTDYQLVLAS
jgi:hypothetical protein